MMAEGWYKMLEIRTFIATPSPKTTSRTHLWSLIYVYNDVRLLLFFFRIWISKIFSKTFLKPYHTSCHFNNLLSFHIGMSANSTKVQPLYGTSCSAGSSKEQEMDRPRLTAQLQQHWPAGKTIPLYHVYYKRVKHFWAKPFHPCSY